jgi:hypothetical protein
MKSVKLQPTGIVLQISLVVGGFMVRSTDLSNQLFTDVTVDATGNTYVQIKFQQQIVNLAGACSHLRFGGQQVQQTAQLLNHTRSSGVLPVVQMVPKLYAGAGSQVSPKSKSHPVFVLPTVAEH